jgi:DNA polymerase III delta prime subunit
MELTRVEQWAASSGEQPPLIVVADPKTGEEIALHAARWIVCEQGSGCGTCLSCRQATTFIHPDIIKVITDDDLVTEQTISIKAIRQLLARVMQTALSARQLVIIPRAERLRADSNNALLKTLEELSDTTRVLLTTQFPLRLLPTLRSRSQLLYAGPSTEGRAATTTLNDILASRTKGALKETELETIATSLETWLHQYGNTPSLARAFLRLRDYYKIQSSRGNESLAADVLVASVAQLRNTIPSN